MPTPTIPGMPPPRFATARDPSRPTRGTRQGHFARIWLGQPLMPWQQYVADVAGEMVQSPETGLWVPAHPFVVCTVQRQAGKSHYCMARKGERCFCVPNYRSWYTAQTGGDARDQFLKFGEQVADSPLGAAGFARTLVGNGREIMKFPNGSWIRPHPPTEKALHGKQSDDNDIDEGWAFLEDHGKLLLQAIAPTQLTRPGAQTFVWSAGGTPESTWLAALVARGRAGDPGVCYFEWAIPDDADAEDLEVIAAHHPAFGHTVTMDSLRTLRANISDPAGWARAAGNRWTDVIGGAIPSDLWDSVRHPDPIPEDATVGYGAARAVDGSQVVIATAGVVDDLVVVEILEVLPTAFGAAEHVAGWATDGPVAVATSGASKSLADDLETNHEDTELIKLNGPEEAAACAKVFDALRPRRYRYRRNPDLDASVASTVKRKLGAGGFVWAQADAGASTAALEAATLAAWAVTHREAAGKPEFHFAA